MHQHRRETPATHEQAEAATTLAREQGFAFFLARGTVVHGWALAMQGQGEEGIAEIRQGLAADLATGSVFFHPYYLGLLAEAYGEGGHPEEELRTCSRSSTTSTLAPGRGANCSSRKMEPHLVGIQVHGRVMSELDAPAS